MKINWIELVKVVGTLMVVLGHIQSPLGTFIFSWHMPLFFICAGFFVKSDTSIIKDIGSWFKRLVVPYFIFGVVGLLALISKAALLSRPVDYSSELTGFLLWADMPALHNSYAFVLWFLPALFFAKIWLSLLLRHVSFPLLQVAIAIAAFFIGLNVQLPFALDESLTALPWLVCGHWLIKVLSNNRKVNFIAVSAAVLSLVLIYLATGIPELDMAGKNYEAYPIANFVWAISLFYICCELAREINLKSNAVLRFLSSGAMIIYVIHPYTNNIAHLVVEFTRIDMSPWLLKFALSCLLLLPLVAIRNRYSETRFFKYV